MIVHKFYFDKDIESVKKSLAVRITKPKYLHNPSNTFIGKIKVNRIWIIKKANIPESFFKSYFTGKFINDGNGCIISGSTIYPLKLIAPFYVLVSIMALSGGIRWFLITSLACGIGTALTELFLATAKFKTRQEIISFFQEELGGEYLRKE